jgi:hypothetical protein
LREGARVVASEGAEKGQPTAEQGAREPIEGKVAKILTARELVINRGSAEGVKQGMKFEVLDPKVEDVTDPDTGASLGGIDRPKVRVEVTRLAEHLAIARTYRSKRMNLGGTGAYFSASSAIAKQFQPPKYVRRYETLKTDESTWEDLNETESFVKTGDPVREIIREEQEE